MSISLCTLAPFGVKLPGLRLGWQTRSSLRAKGAAVTGGENVLEKTMKEVRYLDVLYDDGFGSVTLKGYFTTVRAMLRNDGGPPRWFCPVECGQPKVENAPLLLFLPGTDGVGMELILHHQSLGKVFEVRCLHIPVNDRTSFEGISCAETSLQPILLPLLQIVPTILQLPIPYLAISGGSIPQEALGFLSGNLTSVQPLVAELGHTIKWDTIMWRLKLQKLGASYASSRLHEVQAQILLLARDNLLPNGDVADRLKTMENCKVRHFRSFTDRLILDDNINLLTVIKRANMYRRCRKLDFVTDYLPPTLSEFKKTFDEDFKPYLRLLSPVMLSTLTNGRIVRGLVGVPEKGPILFVSYHSLLAIDLAPICEEFLREKRRVVRVMAHPVFYWENFASSSQELSFFTNISLYGGVPVSPFNMYRLLERNEFVLLFPGGIREALHRKGEEYKLFWPDEAEFVRMAASLGATVIPFGCVGEDDFLELFLDYNEQRSIPYLHNLIDSVNQNFSRIRDTVKGDDGNQVFHLPAVLPKVPGRLYFLFGKPIELKGMKNILKDRKSANKVYMHIKSEVENTIAYLKKKREEDPYRSITQRALYQATWGVSAQVPTFDP
ncbi:unnamed protein product [Urochloa decumbens]|uniref:Acyltransferase n=1 Tax=Urochloa decumbens TaxID=240449 RepID=A0ABC9AAQ8_9POAL